MELLSPAGSWDAMVAACNAGADAIYLGGKFFGARAFSDNFDREETKKALSFLRLRGIKSYITCNTMIKSNEFDDALEWLKFLYEEGANAVIIQDIGLIYAIRELFPEMKVHSSTQMSIGSFDGASILQDMGLSRVVLGRETPISEIKKIHENLNIETEVFAHGALCMSISGKCLLSSLIGGRSGNRGRCAQPCRNLYTLSNQGKTLKESGYYLSPKDLNTLDKINAFKELGVHTLKIEGRMKRPEYVYTMTKIYRKAIDGKLKPEDFDNAEQIFNRGFTKGLTFGEFGKNFISCDRPDNRGVAIGKIEKIKDNKIYLKLYKDLEKGDGLSFIDKNGDFSGFISDTSGKENETIVLNKPYNFGENLEILRTSSVRLLNSAKEERKSYRLASFKFRAKLNEPLKLTMSLNDGKLSVTMFSETKPEIPETKAVDREKIIELLRKTGNTIYEITDIKIEMEENLFFPLKSINQLRREACDEMDACLMQTPDRLLDDYKGEKTALYNSIRRVDRTREDRVLNATVLNKEQLYKISPEKINRIYAPFWDKKLEEFNEKFFILPLYPKNIPEDIEIGEFDGFKISTLDALHFILTHNEIELKNIILGEGFNLSNPLAIAFLQAFWANEFSASYELNFKELEDISNLSMPMELSVYGRTPVMYMRNCPFSAIKNCVDEKNCKDCIYSHHSELIDRKKAIFPIERTSGISVLYNSVPTFLYDKLDKISNLSSNIRLDFTDEIEDIPEIIDLFYNKWITENNSKNDLYIYDKIKESGFTHGHFNRGVE